MRETLVCGIDIGTSSVKVVAATAYGRIVATSSAAYARTPAAPGRAEQDAGAVADAASGALAATVRACAGDGAIRTLAFSCAMHGIVPVDAAGAPLAPLATWLDRRAADVAARWRRSGRAATLYARTGVPVHPMLPSCKLRQLAEDDPDLFRAAARFVSVKELLVYRWTGAWLVDWGLASGTGLYDLVDRAWNADALDAAGVDPSRLSALAPPSTALPMHGAAARAFGLAEPATIVLGSSDGALANLGTGALDARTGAVTLGSSGALRAIVSAPRFDPLARTFCYACDDERFVVGGAVVAGAAVLGPFFARAFPEIPDAERMRHAIACATRSAPGANGVTVAPFFAGERAPFWNADVRGAIAGLGEEPARDDLARAVFESVFFGLRAVADAMGETLEPDARLRASGGLLRDPFLRGLAAGILGRPVDGTDRDEASAFGAALFAAIATGALDRARVPDLVRTTSASLPASGDARAYADAFARYGILARAALELAATRSSAPEGS